MSDDGGPYPGHQNKRIVGLTRFIDVCLIQIESSNQFTFQIFIKQSKQFRCTFFGFPSPSNNRSIEWAVRVEKVGTTIKFRYKQKIISSINKHIEAQIGLDQ